MEHTYYECAKDCVGCMFCVGGLASCTVCGGGEASLLPTCPGYRLTASALEQIADGRIPSVAFLRTWHRRQVCFVCRTVDASEEIPTVLDGVARYICAGCRMMGD